MNTFIGAKTRRLKMNNQDGTIDIPSITPFAEDLSKLTTLKEVREKWMTSNKTTGRMSTLPFGGLFGVGTTLTAPILPMLTKKRTRTTRAPVM